MLLGDRMKTGAEMITDERKRHTEKEGWTTEHDADHTGMELSVSAASYALDCAATQSEYHESWRKIYQEYSDKIWPFDKEWFKPTHDDPIKQLVKAGALLAAEIDRLLAANH